MASEIADITLKPIGVIKNELKEATRGGGDIVSEIVIDSSLADALDYLDEFSHIIVLFWVPQAPSEEPRALKLYPHHDETQPMVGIFATNATERPNPLGMSIAGLLERNGNILKVNRIGAANGTPVIDIRPYIPRNYTLADAKVAAWIGQAQSR